MAIVSSEIIDDRIIGGKRVIEERHVDDKGRTSYCSYSPTKNDDPTAILMTRKTAIEANYAEMDAIPKPLPDQPEVLVAAGVPDFDAPDGQFYYDSENGDLYVRSGGTW